MEFLSLSSKSLSDSTDCNILRFSTSSLHSQNQTPVIFTLSLFSFKLSDNQYDYCNFKLLLSCLKKYQLLKLKNSILKASVKNSHGLII